MTKVIAVIGFVAQFIWWLIQKWFPYLIKKFGIGSVKFAIQKTIQVLLITTTIAFFGMVIVFINDAFTIFRQVVELLNNPGANLSGESASYFSCFLNLLSVSGIASGFNSAASFGISVLIFIFLRGAYTIAIKALKTINEELYKSLKLV